MKPIRYSSCARAFTLVELLAVIAIIALLVSILMPALSKARGTAQRAACQGNMRNIGQGILSYAAANREFMPPDWVTLRPEQNVYDWSVTPAKLVMKHPWSVENWWYWKWPDFIAPHFDPEATPINPKNGPRQSYGGPSIGRQPADGVYDRFDDYGVRFSRRMNCPTQNRTEDWFEYSYNGGWGGEWWQGPSYEQPPGTKHSPDLPPPVPWWAGRPTKLGDLRADQFVTLMEPGHPWWGGGGTGYNPYGDCGNLDPSTWWSMGLYMQAVPHLNKTTNVLFLEGRVEFFTQQFIKDFISAPYCARQLPFWPVPP